MKVLGLFGLGVVLAASMSMTVTAEEAKAPDAVKGHKGQRVEAFKKADANADCKLSLDEFKTMAKGADAEKKFTAADVDKDGFLTSEELKAAKRAAHDAAKAAKAAKCPCAAPAVPAVPAEPAK